MTTYRVLRIAFLCFAVLSVAAPAFAGSPAKIQPADAGWQRAERSFERFAANWMKKLDRTEASRRRELGGAGSSYLGYTDRFEIELRATGVSSAPYVGILRYSELTYRCSSGKRQSCKVAARTPITEIFRLEGSRWMY